MRDVAKWLGLALLAVSLVVVGGCSSKDKDDDGGPTGPGCVLTTAQLAGTWNTTITLAGQSESGPLNINANGGIVGLEPVAIVADCNGRLSGSGTYQGVNYSINGQGTVNRLEFDLTLSASGQSATMHFVMTRA